MEIITPTQTKNKTQNKILRINIDGNWNASDFIAFISIIYRIR